jgi:hypothetical protein
LQLIYIDVVKSDILKVPHGDPRAIYVTTDMLDLLDLTDLKCRTADGPVYGKLEVIPMCHTFFVEYMCASSFSIERGNHATYPGIHNIFGLNRFQMDESTYADECNHGNTATSSSHDVGAKNASDPCSHSLPVIHVDKVIDL